jgi:hypothetical protein
MGPVIITTLFTGYCLVIIIFIIIHGFPTTLMTS